MYKWVVDNKIEDINKSYERVIIYRINLFIVKIILEKFESKYEINIQ
jgi:hypothetical protein